MNIVLLSRMFQEGEAATEYFKAIASRLIEEGNEVHVVAFDDRSYYSVNEEVNVHRVELPFEGDNIYNWSMMMNNELKRKAREIFEEEDLDIVHAIDWTAAPAGVVLSKAFDIPLVMTFQSTENIRGFKGEHAPMISELEWQGAFEAEKVIATSDDVKNSLLFDLDVPGEKLEVIDPFRDGWPQNVLNSYRELVKQEKEAEIT
ncbi:MAG: glycosyltransferase family 4 protein [Candidatus Aenigmatarchaeota archaeon]